MIVWRVQNKEGLGPYMSIDSILWRRRSHDTRRHPEPPEDNIPLMEVRESWKCGFKTKKQALEWFAKTELVRLERLGFTLQKVEAKRVWRGNRQVVFIPK